MVRIGQRPQRMLARRLLPSPLWGGDGGGGSRGCADSPPPPSPALPHKRGGSAQEFAAGATASRHHLHPSHCVSVGGMRSAFGGRKERSNTWPAVGACGSS